MAQKNSSGHYGMHITCRSRSPGHLVISRPHHVLQELVLLRLLHLLIYLVYSTDRSSSDILNIPIVERILRKRDLNSFF